MCVCVLRRHSEMGTVVRETRTHVLAVCMYIQFPPPQSELLVTPLIAVLS